MNNPELLKSVVLDAKFNRAESKSDLTVELSTVSQSENQVKRIELVYSSKLATIYSIQFSSKKIEFCFFY